MAGAGVTEAGSRARLLVAGIGNIFFSDDGFGPAVVHALLSATDPLPDGVRVVDYGIRGMHLTYDLLAGYEGLVLIDAIPGNDQARGEIAAGEIVVRQVGSDDLGDADFDPHAMAPVAVLASLGSLGGNLPPTYVVGCVPADTSEGIGLSGPVTAAVPEAATVVADLVDELVAGLVGTGLVSTASASASTPGTGD